MGESGGTFSEGAESDRREGSAGPLVQIEKHERQTKTMTQPKRNKRMEHGHIAERGEGRYLVR